MHWQGREFNESAWGYPWSELQFEGVCRSLLKLTNLTHISIFIQGPLHLTKTYGAILQSLDHMYSKMTSPTLKQFVVRLPYPFLCPRLGNHCSRGVEALIHDLKRRFFILRPSPDSLGNMADQDTGADFGWRQGGMYLRPNDASFDLVLRCYTVWTQIPPGTKWPCMIRY
jgi:hypothetical protein